VSGRPESPTTTAAAATATTVSWAPPDFVLLAPALPSWLCVGAKNAGAEKTPAGHNCAGEGGDGIQAGTYT